MYCIIVSFTQKYFKKSQIFPFYKWCIYAVGFLNNLERFLVEVHEIFTYSQFQYYFWNEDLIAIKFQYVHYLLSFLNLNKGKSHYFIKIANLEKI